MFQIYAKPLSTIIQYMFSFLILWTVLSLVARNSKYWRYTNWVLAAISVGIIFYMTIYGRAAGERRIVLIPFQNFFDLEHNPEYTRTMLMNVFLFFPFGMTFPFALKRTVKNRILYTVLLAFSIALLIEGIQFIWRIGQAETDDLLMNALGAGIGTLSFALYSKIRTFIKK